ncbi:class I SAM-dependent methyltransferase [Bowmanella denitrificans]|uniref:class I SAM-dependent methyltransferase n=1 Tax=Bowmanella denitrificans TaxID=366582 RepID=UPI000C9A6E9D|nr:class I SAM-dependent methyltransferase [Bowmanella denitrificans]
MATGQQIETRGHVVGFKEEISKAAETNDNTFFTWFDAAKDKDTAFVRGSWDFSLHMAQEFAPHISRPEEKVIMEIGHGAGRILAAASRSFKHAIGVDIHENNEKVAEELNARGIDNFTLYQSDGKNLPVPDDSVDCAYSFIVFQHLEKIEVFEHYLQEINRVLKPGGVAVIYFGRKYKHSINRDSRLRYLWDKWMEGFRMPKGYEELPAKVNMTNLRVSLSYARAQASECGFKVHKELVSKKTVPDGVTLYGGQNGLVLFKL